MLTNKTIQDIYLKSLDYMNESKSNLVNFRVDNYYIDFVFDIDIKKFKYFIINKNNYEIYIIDIDEIDLIKINRNLKINKIKNKIGKKQ